jgi:uncharacterized protein (DUF697 family)
MGIRDFVSVVREISFDDLEAEARMTPRVLVISTHESLAREIADRVFGTDVEDFVDVKASDDTEVDPLRYDVVLTVGPLDPGVARTWRELYRRLKEPLRLVEHMPSKRGEEFDVDALRRRISECADDRAIAIGRYIPAMKTACAHQIVSETATVNAQFALVSNLPTLLPIVGNVLAVGADFIVLTKNQMMLIFKLAAIHGRDLDQRQRMYAEMLPVVGAGLAWRTVAREVVTMLPLAIGTVPKVAIAFAGTWAIGEAAEVYYERGERVNREQMRALYNQALELMKQNPIKSTRLSSNRMSPRVLKPRNWRAKPGELPESAEAD